MYCSILNTSTPTSLLHAFLRILECTSPPWEAARALRLSMATGLEERHSNMRRCFSFCHGKSAKIDQNVNIHHYIRMFSRTSAQSQLCRSIEGLHLCSLPDFCNLTRHWCSNFSTVPLFRVQDQRSLP